MPATAAWGTGAWGTIPWGGASISFSPVDSVAFDVSLGVSFVLLSSVDAIGQIDATVLWGVPTIESGATEPQVFVGLYDRAPWWKRGTLRLVSRSRGRFTGEIVFQGCKDGKLEYLDTDNEWIPTRGVPILIKDSDLVIFRGFIKSIKSRRHEKTNFAEYRCVLADVATIADRFVVRRQYPGENETWDIADVIRDVFSQYLEGEGVTLHESLPATLGTLETATSAYIKVSQLFDDLCSALGGWVWFGDNDGSIRFLDPTDDPDEAPIELTEDSEDWRNLETETTDVGYRNRQILISNRHLEGERTETYTLARWGDRPNLEFNPSIYDDDGGYQEEAFANGYLPWQLLLRGSSRGLISATVNDVPINVGTGFADMTPDEYSDWFSGASQWILCSPGYRLCNMMYGGGPHPPLLEPGDVVSVTYVPENDSSVFAEGDILEVEANDDPADGELIELFGSGVYEEIDQVNDIETEAEAQALAESLRDSLGVTPKNVVFETDVPGLYVGQKIYCDLPRNILADQWLYVIEVSFDEEASGTDLGRGSIGRWKAKATNLTGLPDWVKTMERLWRRSQHPKPIDEFFTTTIVLGSGGGVVLDGQGLNPGILDADGTLVDIVVQFDDPPTDQDLLIDITLEDVSILTTAKIVVADGDDSQQTITTFATALIRGEKNQNIRVDLSYQNAGASPLAAKNGTIKLRWRRTSSTI